MPEIEEYISKSDFMVAWDCPAKLYYKKLKYPSTRDDDDYMRFLAEGGYTIGKLATLLMPGGIEVGRKNGFAKAVAETAELLKRENALIYEAGIFSGSKLVFIDILEKKGNVLNLIEVKSKSTNSSDIKPDPKMKDYYPDVAFQTLVLKEAFPRAEIHSFLFLPDKAKRTKIEGLAGWFRRLPLTSEEKEMRHPPIRVEFLFPGDQEKLRQLADDGIMVKLPVDDKVRELAPLVGDEATRFIESVKGGLKKIDKKLTTKCFKCEYRPNEKDRRDGFRDCWGKLADFSPHISELYRAGQVGVRSEAHVDKLIDQGRTRLSDIKEEMLRNKDKELGAWGRRQLIQIRKTRENCEWFSPEMREELDSWEYPLWFIDFETSLSALPFHRNMRPYELVAFQWSCHRVDSPGATPVHAEWIHIDKGFPNFKFAESLMAHVGDRGTPLMWAKHENTVLKTILRQMDVFVRENDKLREWLTRMTNESDKKKSPRKGRLVDMCDLTMNNYFHPEMKGSNSLKKVLPAVWKNNPYLHKIDWFKEYADYKGGKAVDPYETLGGDVEELGEDLGDEHMPAVVVRDGTGAMRAYYDMTFGECANDPIARAAWKEKLLKYCKLDTMSMVIVWTHWMKLSTK